MKIGGPLSWLGGSMEETEGKVGEKHHLSAIQGAGKSRQAPIA